MGRQHVPPCRVTDALQDRGRVDDVGEEDCCEDPLTGPFGGYAELSGTRPLERHPWLVADHPCVVTRRDLVDRVGQDVELLAVVHHDVHEA